MWRGFAFAIGVQGVNSLRIAIAIGLANHAGNWNHTQLEI
jgi:hypothetical protein